jgi:uncharacterized protein YpmS
MKFKKTVYFILIALISFLIAIAPSMAGSFENENNDKVTNINKITNKDLATDNIVVIVKAATIGVNTSTNNTPANSSNTSSKAKKIVKPTKISQDKIISASSYVDKYVKKNKKLPKYVTISGYKYTMP